jgi:hypothetical protein
MKEVAEFYQKLLQQNISIIALFARNIDVDEFNVTMSNINNINTLNIYAEDTEIGIIRRRKNESLRLKLKSKKEGKKASETAGLEECLKLGVNSRVMLRRNIDLSAGLCYGKLGYVKKIVFGQNNYVDSLVILFDSNSKETVIKRIEANYQAHKNVFVKRKQFPICLAWGITIHKCQGLSLDGVLVDLGKSVFEAGMAYVALSRARSLKNVYLIDFDPSSIRCNSKAIIEYNRLRKKFQPTLDLINKWNNIPGANDKTKLTTNSQVIENMMSKSVQELNIMNATKINSHNNKRKITLKDIDEPKTKINKSHDNQNTYNNYFLKLNNSDASSCYANVCIQMFLSCGQVLFREVSI